MGCAADRRGRFAPICQEDAVKDLEAICRKIDRLEGDALALEGLVLSLCEVLPPGALPVVQAFFQSEIAGVRHKLNEFAATRSTVESFEVGARRIDHRLSRVGADLEAGLCGSAEAADDLFRAPVAHGERGR